MSCECESTTACAFSMKVGDRSPSVQATLTNGSTDLPIDLTTATGVQIRVKKPSATFTRSATIVTAASGIVKYDWQSGDVDEQGTYLVEWIVTFPTSLPQTFPSGGYNEIVVYPVLA